MIILACVATLGLTMAVRWVGVYRATGARPVAAAGRAGRLVPAARTAVPPERNFPVTVVVTHGLLAVTTVILVVLTALGAGGS